MLARTTDWRSRGFGSPLTGALGSRDKGGWATGIRANSGGKTMRGAADCGDGALGGCC